ncbi:MAG: riboflavin biosynthesis protein RibF [Clostridia bacterium]|nr:riboflavin biosynthesis protein RibF [Clostridia bacterium]
MRIKNVIEKDEITAFDGCFVALGRFDGLHIGHQAVINSGDGRRVVLSIDKTNGAQQILTRERFLQRLQELDVDAVISPDFRNICDMSPEEFVRDVLKNGIGAKKAACGYNFRFGKGASANADDLYRLCGKYDIECIVVPKVELDGEEISSSAIRRCLKNGEIEKAEKMLGAGYCWQLEVVKGRSLGRTLGTPTINQHFPQNFFLPRFGVYASQAVVGGEIKYSVTNIGIKPTVGSDAPLAETWIPEYSGDLYGTNMEVRLLSFLRDERKFSSIEELRAAIHSDAERAKAIFDNLQK